MADVDIADFLTARYASEEAQARDTASRNAMHWSCPSSAVLDIGDEDLVLVHDSGVGEHIARHDPARVLADIAAKRRRLLSYREAFEFWTACEIPANREAVRNQWLALDFAMRTDASVYAEHPDYDPAWRIDG